MQLENIPAEMRALRQWVVASGLPREDGSIDKIPLNPRNGHRADVTDPETWGSFEEAVKSGAKLIGFVLSDSDPFTIIDLDDKETNPATAEDKQVFGRIIRAFDSYAEVSASGRGVHVIVRGTIPRGIRRDKVEVYSSQRYMICTGNKINDLPIAERQDLLMRLFVEMENAGMVDQGDIDGGESHLSDMEVVEMGLRAANSEKFDALTRGDISQWPSQSEADLALLSMLCYYSQDNEQVQRIFMASPLGKREKAQRKDYVPRTIRKIRASRPRVSTVMAFITQLLDEHEKERAHAHDTRAADPSPVAIEPAPDDIYPPGLIGEVARYIHSSVVRPVPEIALAASLALMAGVCGRSWNISGTGLNQYYILLAPTGTGKEGAKTGIEQLLAATRTTIPMVEQFMGPATFASGQALIRALDEQQCFMSILNEFGITLKMMTDPKANGALAMLRRVYLDLYTKSGATGVLRSSAYADSEKNTKTVFSPAFSCLGDSTPEEFFEDLDLAHVNDGLLPRFSVIEYKGDRPARNKGAGKPPSPELVSRFSDIVIVALNNLNTNNVNPVHCDTAALELLDTFDDDCTNKINAKDGTVAAHLWNRAHLKSLKLSALIAVGVNKDQPVVTGAIARWAIDFVKAEVANMLEHFNSGSVGVGEHRAEGDLRKVWDAYAKLTPEQRKKNYQVPEGLTTQPRLVPLAYLRARLRLLKSFKDDRRGASAALESLLASLNRAGIIEQIPPGEAFEKFGTRSPVYTKGPSW